MDPANPFNNVCHGFSWDEIREEADETLNSRMLRDVTSTDWHWENHQWDGLVRKPGLQQHPSQENKPNHKKKIKKKKILKKLVIVCKRGMICFLWNSYSYCKLLLRIPIVNSCCKFLCYILIEIIMLRL